MGINDIIIYLMVIFMVVAAIDKCLDNKFGLGEQMEEGFMAMGSLTLAMVGVICLAPVLSNILKPIVVPLYNALGADPAMFATTLLANDMGGFQLAVKLANSPEAGMFAGVILGAMMGPTIVFTIPVALGIIKKEDHKFLATGVLAGIITIPLGAIAGGLTAGYSIIMILKNLVPIILFAALIVIGLWKIPDKIIKGFTYFGKTVVVIITLGLAAAVVEKLTGIVTIPGMAPIEEGFAVVSDIAVVLAGAFPMVYVITKVFKKPLMSLGKILGMNDIAAAGMIASLANNIPMFGMMKDMDDKGKIINVAFAVSASFVFGDHLGFVAGVAKNMIFPMIIGKLVAGITAVAVAVFISNKIVEKEA
ncbi:ethanolamine utilization protein EutH [Clostridium sporogenes]|uniref:Ethanolamine utilization protein EutH n=2 Tax=Clostridium TaxID=1485 RepID=A0A6M0SY75_CLOBO|nr:ethanolamine utilization protein EutH [Clostridium sporogenes]NFA60214.1 ethanolamine utilization protein EutH [Clostridium botulinum]MDS1002328.1 ethanolamine utilization protein EutH [Clostridium sporogenes]NFI72811.1 ethanolamine utilization protein EutH [Clostridium sporogenes]NFL72402.1 ethanolamine utilization protein EutH [Clostridium sporogenes]NFM23415.1 ethanolamine utilization protein EutH [Clostridium sporogenes]